MEPDKDFFSRADAHINLCNAQLSEAGMGVVSASTMYALARFNAWVCACGCNSTAEMEAAKQETIDYFSEEYKKMLTENLEDYIANFDSYMNKK